MKYILSVLVIVLLTGCSTGKIKLENLQIGEEVEIFDLLNLPQNASAYLKTIKVEDIQSNQAFYEENYFRVWNKVPTDTKEVAMWPFDTYRTNDSYGENLQPLNEDFFISMEKNANFEKYKSINKNALTLKHLSIRAFPTSKPLLHKPTLAGEGFPFDYMQNSTVSANKPILISHYSKDKEWAYIFTSFTGGWVKSNDIVIVDKKYTQIWQKAEQVFLVKDGVSIYDADGRFLFKSKIGMMLALVDENKNDYTVLTVSSYKGNQPLYLKSRISKDIAHKGVMKFENENINSIMNEISKSKYGWGGVYDQRDCSSSLRDFYAPFGLWLPRNSYQQSRVGEIIDIEAFNNEEKIKIIKEKAIPFKTLFYKKGHILLYVGIYNDTVVAFHNIWGIKTKKDDLEGRIVIGKAVFSSLYLGSKQKYFDSEAGILENINSMNIISN